MAYNRATGNYEEDGRVVPRGEILSLVEQEATALRGEMIRQTNLLLAGQIDLGEWQKAVAAAIKESNLRMTLLASGGRENITQKQYGMAGFQIRQQYQALERFAKALAAGELTPEQVQRRAALYGDASRQAFYASERITRILNGANEGRRSLDPQAQHCPQCPGYATSGWVDITTIIPPGARCQCSQRCRCRVQYRRNPDLPPAELPSNLPPAYQPRGESVLPPTDGLGFTVDVLSGALARLQERLAKQRQQASPN